MNVARRSAARAAVLRASQPVTSLLRLLTRALQRRLSSLLTVLLLAGSGWSGLAVAGPTDALFGASAFCDRGHELTASEQDKLLRFSAVVREALAATGDDAVLISRSGLDLSGFGIRYSHSAIAWRSDTGVWSARQLYYACNEGFPRIFDQGIAGFVMGTDDPAVGYISIVSLPKGAADTLRDASRNTPLALQLLAAQYSANAYAYSTRYQNCNQWVIEMLGATWGGLAWGQGLRERTQDWLLAAGYAPEPVNVGSHWLMFASGFVPLLHLDDHPMEDRQALQLQISLPASIEGFVRERYPDAKRVELCHSGGRVVTHAGWTPMAEGCVAGAGDGAL